MKSFLRSLFLLSIVFFVSCGDTEQKGKVSRVFPVEVNDEYSIELPRFMKKATDLHDEASLQYQNIYKETYIIVIDDPKQEFIDLYRAMGEYNDSVSVIENYQNVHFSFFRENMVVGEVTSPAQSKVNGLDARTIQMNGEVEGVPGSISYVIGFIEGEENLYMIMGWTLKNRMSKYRSDFQTAIQSFRLVDKQEASVKASEGI